MLEGVRRGGGEGGKLVGASGNVGFFFLRLRVLKYASIRGVKEDQRMLTVNSSL